MQNDGRAANLMMINNSTACFLNILSAAFSAAANLPLLPVRVLRPCGGGGGVAQNKSLYIRYNRRHRLFFRTYFSTRAN